MKGLLIKDVRLLKNQMSFMILVVVFAVVCSVLGKNIFFAMGYVSSFTAIWAVTSISYDDYDNGMAYLFTLPFERNTYVREKYVFGILLEVVAVLFCGGIAFVTSAFRQVSYGAQEWLTVIGMSSVVSLLIVALTFPVQIKFGSEKSRIATFVVILAFLGCFYLAVRGMEWMGIDLDAGMKGATASPIKAAIVLAILVVVALGISYKVALRILEGKEF